MYFPDLPVLDEFSYVFMVLMDFVTYLWEFLTLPIYNADPLIPSLIETLFSDVPGWVLSFFNILNAITFDSVPILHYSLLDFLITNLVVVVLVFWVLKFFRSIVSGN